MGIDRLLRESQSPPPRFSPQSAALVALEHFGVEGACRPLAGERDLNFCLEQASGCRYLLKIWNLAQGPAIIDFQLGALRHLELNAPELPVPRLLRTLDGDHRATVMAKGNGPHAVCLLTWMDGHFLRDAPRTPTLCTHLGRSLARLDLALADYEHAASHRDMLWDVSRAHRLRPLLSAVPDPAIARLASAMLDRFESQTLPALPSLPHQVVHADFNLDNVLVRPGGDWEVCGIIDFGDALFAPRVCDLAIASAYHLACGDDPLARVRGLVTSFNDTLEMGEEELLCLPDLIGARLVSSALITWHMAALHPQNREYLLIDTRAAAANLERLLDHDPDALADDLIRACKRSADRASSPDGGVAG